MSAWLEWVQHPEKNRVRNALFNAHLLTGAVAGIYVVLMSLSGSMIIYRAEMEKAFPSSRAAMEWLVKLHGSLLLGPIGRFVNGIGSICLTVLAITGAVIWWPGIRDWRRALTVNWKAHLGRISWDTHSALGFWCFPFVLLWGLSSLYFAFPRPFYGVFNLIDPRDRFTDAILAALSALQPADRGALDFPGTCAGSAVSNRCVSVLPPDDLQDSGETGRGIKRAKGRITRQPGNSRPTTLVFVE